MPDPLSTLDLPGLRRPVDVPQSAPVDERQALNAAGGYTFTVDELTRLRRFLTLGTTGGTYYVGEAELTRANAELVVELARRDGVRAADLAIEFSVSGRAPKNDPALFVLAAVAGLGSDEARKVALNGLQRVARTGTHLLTFARYVEQFRGWGRGLRTAVAGWYEGKTADDLAYQVVKYAQRGDWSHRDLLRLAHPEASTEAHTVIYDHVCGRGADLDRGPELLPVHRALQASVSPRVTAAILEGSPAAVSWEMVQSEHLNDPAVWEVLLDRGMPQTALMRNLPKLTRLGVLKARRLAVVVTQLADAEMLRKARVHPINVLVAQRTYAGGQSLRGSAEWTPVRQVVDALDAAFYAAFGAVQPTGKRIRLALDVSGSMAMAPIAGMPLTPRDASAALAMVTAATESDYDVVGFTSGALRSSRSVRAALTPLDISPRRRLDDNIRAVSDLPFGGTDCALPILDALQRGLEFDTFVVYTDNETYAGTTHPHIALQRYRAETGIDAKLAVVGMTATECSIADPTDPGMLDIAGFDSAVPALLSDFARAGV